MIKEGVVKSDKTPCPKTGKACTCEHPENECVYTKGKVASAAVLGAMISEEDSNK
jgi:hypothetical protein